jgi:SAM-dependent methyltransferase
MQYDEMHVNESDEHFLALHFLGGVIEHFDFQSALDIGSGTGRAVDFLIRRFRGLRVVGIEPVAELRAIGHKKGIPSDALVPGDAMRLAYENDAFDVVCEFGMLHHIPEPHRAVAEMLRVARHAVFISDSNNFGQGSFIKRSFKQLVNLLGLWKAFDSIKTRGKGFRISEGDGLSYSYSVFNNYSQIRHACSRVHILNTTSTAGINLYRSASHVALLGIK